MEDAKACSFKPWADVMEGIFKEEAMHMAHGFFGDWLAFLGWGAPPRTPPKVYMGEAGPGSVGEIGRGAGGGSWG